LLTPEAFKVKMTPGFKNVQIYVSEKSASGSSLKSWSDTTIHKVDQSLDWTMS